ncbi:MAG: Fic family protein [Bacteroidales bacterium]
MEQNKSNHLQEIVFATSDAAESRQLVKLHKQGLIRKIAPKIYTSNFEDNPVNIIKRNLYMILGRLFPKAILSHRTAFEFSPTDDGHIFLTYSYTKNILLPGIKVHLMEGPSALDDDIPFIEGLYASQRERAFLENMQISRKTGTESKILARDVVVAKIEQFICLNGESAINLLLDKAKKLSVKLNMKDEYDKLTRLVGSLLISKPSDVLSSPLAMARTFGFPYDPSKIEIFNKLYTTLLKDNFKALPEQNTTYESFRSFSFFESYFSSFLDGAEFDIDEAKKIIDTKSPVSDKKEASNSLLGIFSFASNKQEMTIVPKSSDEMIEILQYRHRVVLAARKDEMPGEFRYDNIFGNTHYDVDFNKVKGTLIKGFDYYNTLQNTFAKAIFLGFMLTEIRPFFSGNGRIARLMMNAEFVRAGEAKIIIPSIYKDDYLVALHKMSTIGDAESYIKTMKRIHQFSSMIRGESYEEIKDYLKSTKALY